MQKKEMDPNEDGYMPANECSSQKENTLNFVDTHNFPKVSPMTVRTTSNDYSSAIGKYSQAYGYRTKAIGKCSHTEGRLNVAIGESSHSEGHDTHASGFCSHGEGTMTFARGDNSHTEGEGTEAYGYAQHVMGRFNHCWHLDTMGAYSDKNMAFVIGNGNIHGDGNAFLIKYNGETYSEGPYSNGGTGYAEMFRWKDDKAPNNNGIGMLVTLRDGFIYPVSNDEEYVLGVVTGAPMVIGNNPIEWKGRYADDPWGRPKYEHELVRSDIRCEFSDNGYNVESINDNVYKRAESIAYDAQWDYIPRMDRPNEWACVCLVGRAIVRQDGTLRQNGYCRVGGTPGMVTDSDRGYYVYKILDESKAVIVLK